MMDHLARVRCVQAKLPKRERGRAAVEVDDQEGFPQPRKKKETRLYCDREPCKTRKSQANPLNLRNTVSTNTSLSTGHRIALLSAANVLRFCLSYCFQTFSSPDKLDSHRWECHGRGRGFYFGGGGSNAERDSERRHRCAEAAGAQECAGGCGVRAHALDFKHLVSCEDT